MTEPIKILVIDDSEDDRLLYRRALQKSTEASYNIAEADEGNKGLAAIPQIQPACILLDYSMPGLDGIEILKRIRSAYPFVPVVMLTGQGNEKIAVTAMQEGAQNYIAKSTINSETLDHVIRMAVEHCSLTKRIHEQRTSLEVFTRALAHDLKEPVRTIHSFTELLAEKESFSEQAKTYFEYIQNAAARMQTLIETVFLYTQLDGTREIIRGDCDINKVIAEVKDNIGRLIQEKQAVIILAPLPSVFANHTQLLQVFQNLLCNAMHHSKNPVSIHVSASEQEDNWLFRVSDNGPGIAEAYIQKIFEPFKRLTNENELNTGLGLAICRKIIELHGGTIWCESGHNKGAIFFFTLPKVLQTTKVTDQPIAQKAGSTTSAHTSNTPLANVLLVDDRKADLEMTKIMLITRPHLQCNLSMARSGEEALTRLKDTNNPIHLMLLDINMPEMDGFELLARIKESGNLPNDMVVVMCTGSDYDKDMDKAESLGAIGYLVKPGSFPTLTSIIDKTSSLKLCAENDGYILFSAQ